MSWLDSLLARPPVTGWDLLDIAIVAIVVYELLKLIRGTRASQMAVAIGAIVALFYASRALGLETVNWLIRNVVGYVVFAAIVLLQTDIRRALVHFGRGPFFRFLRRVEPDEDVGRGAGGRRSRRWPPSTPAPWSWSSAASASAITSKAASRSTPSSPTTCW